jgi:hypothetical protein
MLPSTMGTPAVCESVAEPLAWVNGAPLLPRKAQVLPMLAERLSLAMRG